MSLLKEFSIITKKENCNNFFVSHESIDYFKENMFHENLRFSILDNLCFEINNLLCDFKENNMFISLSDLTTLAFLHLSIEDFIEEQYCNSFSTIFSE